MLTEEPIAEVVVPVYLCMYSMHAFLRVCSPAVPPSMLTEEPTTELAVLVYLCMYSMHAGLPVSSPAVFLPC